MLYSISLFGARLKCRLACLVLLVPNERLDCIFAREAGDGTDAVFPDATDKIISHADVERSITAAGENVHIEAHAVTPGSPLSRGRAVATPQSLKHEHYGANISACASRAASSMVMNTAPAAAKSFSNASSASMR